MGRQRLAPFAAGIAVAASIGSLAVANPFDALVENRHATLDPGNATYDAFQVTGHYHMGYHVQASAGTVTACFVRESEAYEWELDAHAGHPLTGDGCGTGQILAGTADYRDGRYALAIACVGSTPCSFTFTYGSTFR